MKLVCCEVDKQPYEISNRNKLFKNLRNQKCILTNICSRQLSMNCKNKF